MESFSEMLKQELKERQGRNPNFSVRAFARWLEISPAQLSQLMSGKRRVTVSMGHKIIEKLGLSPMERQKLMTALPGWVEQKTETLSVRQLREDQFRLISDWYHFAILSLTRLPRAEAHPLWVSSQLGISIETARDAMDRLVRLGVLQLTPTFKQIGEPISVASEDPSQAIRKYHKQILKLATEKIDTTENQFKDFQGMTLAIDKKKIPMARQIIDEALSKVTETLESGTSNDVYSCSIQLFPLTVNQSEERES